MYLIIHFQAVLQPEFQIKIWQAEAFNAKIFQGEVSSDKVLNLYLQKNHFWVITKVRFIFQL